MKNEIRVLAVDDHPLVREGIVAVINAQPDMRVIAEASSGKEAFESFHKDPPDITLMDIRLPDMSGIDVVITLRAQFPEARIIILTTFDYGAEIHRALAAGARSYILKTMPPKEIAEAIRRVHEAKKHIPPAVAERLAEQLGDESLTERETQVLQLVSAGNRNRDIADHLFISEETVKAHIKHAIEKLRATDRTQAVTIAVKRGIIQF